MKLTDLDPRWYAQSGRHGQGVSFDCPHCRALERSSAEFSPTEIAIADAAGRLRVDADGLGFVGPAMLTRIVVPFDRPLDGGSPVSMRPDGQIVTWARTGDTFETLTLSPSIDFHHGNGRWHGFITNGEVTTC